jgi:hypothetical protein
VRIAERAARGKAARSEVPRSSHAAYEPAAGRGDRIELLERQAATRVPELVPVRYGRMLVSPFGFCRGEARIMADDLAATSGSGLQAQRCRDADGRQLKDWKGSGEIERVDPERTAICRVLCGGTRARGHARTGDRVAIASYLGNGAKSDRASLELSSVRAEQNGRDHQQLVDAVNSGRVVTRTGPCPDRSPMSRCRRSASDTRRSSRPMPAPSPVLV